MPARRVKPYKCECGSTWFREHWFSELPDNLRFLSYLSNLEDKVVNPIPALVCLCGRPVPLTVPGMGGRNAAKVIQRYQTSLKKASEGSPEKTVAAFQEQLAVERAQLTELRKRLRRVSRSVGRMLAKQDVAAGTRKARGRYWEAPRRVSANKGAHKGRDTLVLELQKRGVTFRKARAAVKAWVNAMRELLQRDRRLQTPIGEFTVRSRSRPRNRPWQRKRFGRDQLVYARPTVVWEPAPEVMGGRRKK